jgi:hypothetical protein
MTSGSDFNISGFESAGSKQSLASRPVTVLQVSGMLGYKHDEVRDPASFSAKEPLNFSTALFSGLCSTRNDEGRETRAGEVVIDSVPVISSNGQPLMPCTATKCRKLIRNGLAEKHWNGLGQFFIQLKFDPKNSSDSGRQPICLALDPGSKWDGLAIISTKRVLLGAMLVLPIKVSEKLRVRRNERRRRRYRKTPRRARRFGNRRKLCDWISPSQRAKVDFKIKIIEEQLRIYPICKFVVEDVRFNHLRRRRNKFVSQVEVGKTKLYRFLESINKLELVSGIQTSMWRDKFGLHKNRRKNSLSWDSHAIDAIAIGCMKNNCQATKPSEFWVWKRLFINRRQLHSHIFEHGQRKRRGGSWSLYPFKKGDVVLWKGRVARVGGYRKERLSLHTFDINNTRFSRDARPTDCQKLFNSRVLYQHSKP